MNAPPRRFSLEFEGRTYNATYYHEGRTVTVIWEGADLKRHEISSPTADAWVTARALLRKLLDAASMRGDLVRL
jgi:hypothetical protein